MHAKSPYMMTVSRVAVSDYQNHGRAVLLSTLLCCIVLPASGCSSTFGSGNYLLDEFVNRGPVMLSAKNPYAAANLYVTKEMTQSTVVQGFLDFRGMPDAIEATRKPFRPAKVSFFYLKEREVFTLVKKGDWLVEGPASLPQRALVLLAEHPALGDSHGIDSAPENEKDWRQAARLSDETANQTFPLGEDITASGTAEPNLIEDQEMPEQKPRAAKRGLASTHSALPENKARTSAKTPALSSLDENSGDMIHSVRYHGETLRMIANWYTGDTSNAERLVRINDIANPNVLHLHQTVRIPRYMLKHTDPMPAGEVARYLQEIKSRPR